MPEVRAIRPASQTSAGAHPDAAAGSRHARHALSAGNSLARRQKIAPAQRRPASLVQAFQREGPGAGIERDPPLLSFSRALRAPVIRKNEPITGGLTV